MTEKKGQKQSLVKQIAILARYLKENKNALKTRGMIEKIRTTLTLANMEIAKMDMNDPMYIQRIKEFNEAIILLTHAKWKTTCAMDKNSSEMWIEAFEEYKIAGAYSKELYSMMMGERNGKLPIRNSELKRTDTEIAYSGDTPIIPEINPIIVLQGSDYDMGYQYAQQVVQIFGKWILQLKAGKKFTLVEKQTLIKWEEQIQKYAPELIPFCRGWAVGATDAGVPTAYEDVLDIWTGHNKPATSVMGLADALPKTAAPLCSGIAAWGRATKDGKLITGSSGDHDVSFMTTIVAFPETGNSFIYTPFGVTGDVMKLGPMYMTGHPGMNSKGVAYVEHGGEPRYIEPREYWGYGIRKGASVFHVLRFANSAKEAREIELSMPVGDVGNNFGSVGGFYADSEYGYVLESRKEPVIIRESGVMGETDFLYANNSAMHPDVKSAEWLENDVRNWEWDSHGGWHPSRFTMVKKFGGVSEIVKSVMRTGYDNSFQRNRFIYNSLSACFSKIDMEYIKSIYCQSGTIPEGDWDKAAKAFNKTGKWGKITVGHASNALVTLMKPRNDGTGIYSLCVGSASRGLAPMGPMFCTPIHNETNAFWELELAGNPAATAERARICADNDLRTAKSNIANIKENKYLVDYVSEILDNAQKELRESNILLQKAGGSYTGENIYLYAKAIRYSTRCQVHARQAVQLLAGIR